MTLLRDGSQAEDVRLGRLIEFDERSRNFPMMARIERGRKDADQSSKIRSYRWRALEHHDQRREGACVTFAHGHRVVARPKEILGELTFTELVRKYRRAQQIDPWPETYEGGEEGTSVLAGAKIFTADGLYEGYDWIFGHDDGLAQALVTLSYFGPIIMGTWWKDSMWDTDTNGKIDLSGRNIGGHAWQTYGLVARRSNGRAAHVVGDVDLDRSRIWSRNSWGDSWGKNGDFWMTVREWNDLRLEQGEACVPRERGGYFGD